MWGTSKQLVYILANHAVNWFEVRLHKVDVTLNLKINVLTVLTVLYNNNNKLIIWHTVFTISKNTHWTIQLILVQCITLVT